MKILIDIGHPGHVHLFKNFALRMIENGNSVLFTCREKESEISLLKAFSFNYRSFGKHYNNILAKLLGLIKFDLQMLITALIFKPNVFLSHGSIYASHAAFLLRIPNIVLEDTGNKEQVVLYKPFTKYILTPSVFPNLYGKKQIKYDAYHEIAYLHPKYYIPDESIYEFLDNRDRCKFAILRFVSWKATHDIGKGGIDFLVAQKLIDFFEKLNYRIYISSEKKLPEKFEKYKISIPSHLFHHALYFADIVVGDSQTIIAEAGILGTPAIRFNDLVGTSHGYHHAELENKYKLIYNIHTKNNEVLFQVLDELTANPENKLKWQERKQLLFAQKIDLTEFLLEFVNKRNYGKT
ncbi:MAG TPA: hypothetical protein DEP28_09520 [Bacteroidetes bacterium]|nr:hypothetical protein [Bacteroidota bacterium]